MILGIVNETEQSLQKQSCDYISLCIQLAVRQHVSLLKEKKTQAIFLVGVL